MGKNSFIITMSVVLLNIIGTTQVRAQFVVTDPAHIATSIVNSANQIVQTSSTVSNVIKNFNEVRKVYEQGKQYYDRLASVHDLVRDARKVRDAILLVGEISDLYVNNFQKMLSDRHFSHPELTAISNGYTVLLKESSDMLLELKDVVNVNGLSMTDAERMGLINSVHERLKRQRNLVGYYTRKNISVAYLRARKAGDADRVVALYGTANDRYW